MNRLRDIGFELIGHWVSSGDGLNYELKKSITQRNVLYAFAVNDDVMYIGKTARTISERMYGYKKPSETQRTNVKNNENISKALLLGDVVDIYVLPDNGLMHYGAFHLNLAAGLEDSLIQTIAPPWNGKKLKADKDEYRDTVKDIAEQPPQIFIGEFKLTLHPTYYNKGFFNVPASESEMFGSDGEEIEIYLGQDETPISGIINRRANINGTPRIMAGKNLRDWLVANFKEMQVLNVCILSPCSIKLDNKL